MTAPRLDRDVVLAALRPEDVIATYNIQGRRQGDELRTGVCPSCGPRTRKDAVSINLVSGRWLCLPHGCAGALLELIAGVNQLDVRRDFPRVLEMAAGIAGVTPDADPAEAKRVLERRAAEERAMEEARARRQESAMCVAGQVWRDLRRLHAEGHRYLAIERGLDADDLIARDLVRFGDAGDVYVALWSSTGTIRNLVRRRLRGDPKVLGWPACPTSGTLVGCVGGIGRGATVVITEGVIDTLTACLAWPDALVLGAHGAAELPTIAKVIAPRVAQLGGELLICAHNDPPRKDGQPGVGQERGDEAMAIAIEAGLVMSRPGGEPVTRVHAVGFGPHKDLNDAYRTGWRPAPQRRAA